MGSFIDLTGKQFNRLKVLEKADKRGNEWYWKCQCECGNICFVCGSNLRRNRTKSCGCLKQESDRKPKNNVKDLLNQKFGNLFVIARDGSDARGEAKWLCQCDCGQKVSVLGSNLRSGHTQSCGCDRSSKGEKKIASLLIENAIPFSTQKRFEELGALSFDFYVNNHYLIEYDGETHYQYNLHGWHDEEQLKAQQMRDSRKNQWCLENNIPLIRIPYTHFKDLCIEDLKLETTTFLVKENLCKLYM